MTLNNPFFLQRMLWICPSPCQGTVGEHQCFGHSELIGEWEPAMLAPREGQSLDLCVQILARLSGTFFRGGPVSFKPPPPPTSTRHNFQLLKCFLNLDTSGKFWKILQEGDEAKRAPFLMSFRKRCTKSLPSKTASPGAQLAGLESHWR